MLAKLRNLTAPQQNVTYNFSLALTKDAEEEQSPQANSSYQAIQTTAYCILIFMSLIGNTMVITTVIRNANKRMRSVSNILIVNLSVADLVISLINMPSKIAEIYIGAQLWLFDGTVGLIVCKLMRLLPFLAVFVSTQSFSVLAMDRFVAVYFPVRKPITTKVAYLLVGLVWILAIGFYYPYCHSAVLVVYKNHTFCTTDPEIVFGGVENFKMFVWVEFTVVILIPLVISFVLYSATMNKLWKRKIPGNTTFSNSSYTDRVNRKVLKMLITVFLVFLICWLPSWIWIVNCVRMTDTSILPTICQSNDFRIFRFIVAYSNGAITPFVYLVFSENYRQGFRDIIIAITCCPSVRTRLMRTNRVRPSFTFTLTAQERTRHSIPVSRLERFELTTII